MKTLIVTAVFPPETVVSSQTSAQLADGLLADGHTVRVIAPFPNRPGGQLYPGYRRTLLRRSRREDGLHLTHCFTVISGEAGMVSRFLENISFGLSAGLAFLLEPKPDVIYANTWPTFATGILALLARLRGVPLVVSVQDIYPDQLIAQGRIAQTSLIARLMGWIERRIAARTRAIILISPSLIGQYGKLRRVAAEKMHVIPNWADRDSITPDHPGGAGFRERYTMPQGAFVTVYGGNIAYAAGVETVVDSFGRLSDLPDTHLLIAGEGARMGACHQAAQESGNPRIHFHTPWPRAENSMVLASADLLILPTRGTVSLAAMPSKLISYMLSGRPVLALALPESDLAHVVRDAGCGWVIPPDNPDLLAETIRTIRALPATERQSRGQAGRQYALAHLTREACVPRVIALLRDSVGDR
jgi:glycosyltransferase involved in cell wall biosynthesis